MKMISMWLASAVLAQSAFVASAAPVVKLDAGALSGAASGEHGAAFLGVPFAAPPTGALRWRAPEPVKAWTGERDATKYASACKQAMQGWNASIVPTASEDCLYLNVWTPRIDASAKLPVMVWIHGGAFSGGSATDPIFAGDRLAAKDVVVVTINYRLGVLGFLAHPDFTRESARKVSGNYGLLDQQAALRWVQTNIARFGGDPAKVTVFGQSAGGMSVTAAITSPLTKGLVRSAIIQSGSVLRPTRMESLEAAQAVGKRFGGDLGSAELRALSADELLQRWMKFATPPSGPMLGPVVDGYVLLDDPAATFAKHEEHKVALLIGNNAREGLGRLRDEDLPKAIQDFYGDQAPAALKIYGVGAATPAPVDTVMGSPVNQWITDTTLRCGSVVTAARHATTGLPVYSYQFEQSLPGRERDGAAHSYELPYVFGNLLESGPFGGKFPQADHALSDVMIGYWTNFAKNSDPNGAELPTWPRFDAKSRAYMQLSTAVRGNAVANQGLRKAACDLFDSRIASAAVR